MKLNEIKTVLTGEVDLKEGVIPVHIVMTLEQVINAGKITNNIQSFVMAGLVDMFKGGGPYRWPRDLNAYDASTMSTNSDMIAAVRSLGEDEQAKIAEWLLVELHKVAGYESNPAYAVALVQDPVEWMKYVIHKQD